MKRNKKGFTLVELLVVVLIIGVLAAIALPMYQKAVKRSRFSALMPIVKALNEGNEHYYLNHSVYSTDPAELDIAGKDEYDDDTEVYLVNEDGLSYVMAYNEVRLPDNKYIAFQKHSDNFAETTICEAADEAAGQICESFGGTIIEDGSVTSGWTDYLLSGTYGAGDSLPSGDNGAGGSGTSCPDNSVCNVTGTVTGCDSGYCLKDGACGICDHVGNSICDQENCNGQTFGENSRCVDMSCNGAVFSGHAICSGSDCNTTEADGTAMFTDYASCTDWSGCKGAIFSGHATCTSSEVLGASNCSGSTFTGESSCMGNATCQDGNTTFTDNTTCSNGAFCAGAVFSGSSSCIDSNTVCGGYGGRISTFKDNAVCAGSGCDSATYEGNACCSSCSVGSGKPKCGGGTW